MYIGIKTCLERRVWREELVYNFKSNLALEDSHYVQCETNPKI